MTGLQPPIYNFTTASARDVSAILGWSKLAERPAVKIPDSALPVAEGTTKTYDAPRQRPLFGPSTAEVEKCRALERAIHALATDRGRKDFDQLVSFEDYCAWVERYVTK